TDFASQFKLSIQREKSETKIIFGDTGQYILAEEHPSNPRTDSAGNTYKVTSEPRKPSKVTRRKASKKRYRYSRYLRNLPDNQEPVKLLEDVLLPPNSIKKVKIKTSFKNRPSGYIERLFNTNNMFENLFAITNSLVSADYPLVQITNFSDQPIHVQKGRIIGFMHDPSKYLASTSSLSSEEIRKTKAHATLIKTLIKEKPLEPPNEELEKLMEP
ncbi:hypothetical protein FRC11_001034, partial [Ceratobasidium sp. 423]